MQQGFFSMQQTCPRCQGTGKQIKDPCSSCHGRGAVDETKTLSVKVPAGVDSGDRIRLTGEGQAGLHGGPSGDLYVEIGVRSHHIFQRDGRNLHCEIPISFGDAALGGELEVPTLNGRVKLKIPAATQSGKLFRLRNKGVTAIRGGGAGDLLCRVVVETPIHLTGRQLEIMEEFQQIQEQQGTRQSPRKSSWFEGVKKFVDGLRA
jgi:molecular chaperone DnaJ